MRSVAADTDQVSIVSSPASTVTAAPPPRRRLGDLLVERGAVTTVQLDQALARQKASGGRLGEVLLDLGFVEPTDLLSALAVQFGMEFVNLEQVEVDRALVQKVPEPLARRHRAVPIMDDNGTIVVAMANPGDVIALDDIRAIVRAPVRPVMSDPGQISDVIARSSQGDEQVQDAIRLAVANTADVEEETDLRVVGGLESDDAPVVRFVDLMIGKAVQDRASDIHVESTGTSLRVRYRIDGVLHEVMHPPKSLHAGIVSRIKVMASIDIAV